MAINIRDSQGRVVQRSANLRGIVTRAGKVGVERADVFGPNKQGGGTLGVTFLDGSTVLTDFADYKVLTQWVKERRQFRGVVKIAERVNPAKRGKAKRNPIEHGTNLASLNTDSPIYQERERRPKWNVKVSPLMDPTEGGKMLRRRLPDFIKADHESAARYFTNEAKRWSGAWGALIDREHLRVFGRPYQATDYKIAGIGREEYSEKAKNELRSMARAATDSRAAAAAHWRAAGHRSRMATNPARYLKGKTSEFTRRVVLKRQLAKAGVKVPAEARYDTRKLRALRTKKNPAKLYLVESLTGGAWHPFAASHSRAHSVWIAQQINKVLGRGVRVSD
jgi:hypothetical protein